MGGSKKSSQANTSVTTTTTTNIRDIGLTGNDAVNALTILEAGVIEREKISSERLSDFTDFAESLVSRNAANAVDIAEVAETGTGSLVKLAPFVVGALVLLAPIMLRKR